MILVLQTIAPLPLQAAGPGIWLSDLELELGQIILEDDNMPVSSLCEWEVHDVQSETVARLVSDGEEAYSLYL